MALLQPIAGDEIRRAFLRFFEEKGHLLMSSASLIPAGDPTLLLTSAGMVPFKPFFTGQEKPPNKRLTSVQKCFRTTDIDDVGDESHLTFFEMLGNFSVGDYFKREAIAWAWEFVTEVLKILPEQLWVTVHHDDEEAPSLWRDIGVPTSRILRFGDRENFWGPAGSEGPCGPCSEIHYDFGGACRAGKNEEECQPNCECGRFLELWNLVFMQYFQDAEGNRSTLPVPNVDTGMGLERIAAVMQGHESIYDTDLLRPVLKAVETISGREYGLDSDVDYAIRVVAEHSRSAAFLIADGVTPTNDGYGYVLRRVIRRGIRFARKLGLYDVFLPEVVKLVIQHMGEAYPELKDHERFVLRAVELEEIRFQQVIDLGLPLLEQDLIPFHQAIASAGAPADPGLLGTLNEKIPQTLLDKLGLLMADEKGRSRLKTMITGPEAFLLYDTHGFPLEFTQEIAREYGMDVDVGSFDDEMEDQQRRGRESGKNFAGRRDLDRVYESITTEATQFLGYDSTALDSTVVGLLSNGQSVQEGNEGERMDIVLRETSFYPEGGGQVGDSGIIDLVNGRFAVEDTQRPVRGVIVHRGIMLEGHVNIGDVGRATVDRARREDIARNHTSTHLLHAALRSVLGSHVRQTGSLVAADRLRFDFTHVSAVSDEEMENVQRLVNDVILENIPVFKDETTYREAVSLGALAFFGDQYGTRVRTLKVGEKEGDTKPFSFEVCGGTHVQRSGDIGQFRVIAENGIGTGVRRIEAVTGRGAEGWINRRLNLLDEAAGKLQSTPAALTNKIDVLLEDLERLGRQLEASQRDDLKRVSEELLGKIRTVHGIAVLVEEVVVTAADGLRALGDHLKERLTSGVIVLGSILEGRPILVVMVTKDLVVKGIDAAQVAKAAANCMGGGGGGRSDVGQAGGREPDGLPKALEGAIEFLQSLEVSGQSD